MLKYRFGSSLGGLLHLIRFKTSLEAGAFTLVGAYLSTEVTHLFSSPVMIAALVVMLVVAFSFAFNDYRDVEVDTLSKPYRAIPSGRVSQNFAGILALILASTAFGIAWTLGPWLAIITLATIILSAGYSYRLKNTVLVGNGAIALLDASIIIFGSLAANKMTFAAWLATILIFLYVFAQEILLSIVDRPGDSVVGLRTTATSLGISGALLFFRVFAFLFIVVAILPWSLGLGSDLYLGAVIVCSMIPVVGVVILLSLNLTDDTTRLSLRIIKLARMFGIFPILLLK